MNYVTNDQKMIQYKQIQQYFFLDTFFTTTKTKKSIWGNGCWHLFESNKSFLYAGPMAIRNFVLQALKQFTKEISTLEAIICDKSGK